MIQYHIATIYSPSSASIEVQPLDLQSACRNGDLKAIQKALSEDPNSLNSKDRTLGWTPLYRTVVSGDVQATRYLLSKGANPDIANHLGETPLHQAADNSQYIIAELLLDASADPNTQQEQGDTPLHHSAYKGDTRMVNLLLNRGANPNLPNFIFRRTPLHYAIDCGNFDCAKVMLRFKGDLSIRDKYGKTPLDLTKNPEIRYALSTFQNLDSSSNLSNYLVRSSSGFNEDSVILDAEDPVYVSENEEKLDISLDKLEEDKSNDNSKIQNSLVAWLDKHSISELFDILHENGFMDLESLLERMHSSTPITEDFLKSLGISKLGLRYKLLILLEEESGLQPRAAYARHSIYHGVATTMTFGDENSHIEVCDTLSEWLSSLKLEELIPTFLNNGYCSYEDLVMQMNSRYPLSDSMLATELGIAKPGHRSRILTKLTEDLRPARRGSVIFEQGSGVSCQLCSIY